MGAKAGSRLQGCKILLPQGTLPEFRPLHGRLNAGLRIHGATATKKASAAGTGCDNPCNGRGPNRALLLVWKAPVLASFVRFLPFSNQIQFAVRRWPPAAFPRVRMSTPKRTGLLPVMASGKSGLSLKGLRKPGLCPSDSSHPHHFRHEHYEAFRQGLSCQISDSDTLDRLDLFIHPI